VPVYAQVAQVADDLLHALAGQVSLEQVTAGLASDTRQHDDVGCPRFAARPAPA
jgi:hypothetical protein